MSDGIGGPRRGLGQSEVLALITNLLSDVIPLELGTATAGVAVEAARDDHVHAHGTFTIGDLHENLQQESEKSQANGYASLEGAGRVPAAEAPGKAVYSQPSGAQALVPADVGLGTTFTLAATPPAFAALVTVPASSGMGRWVFGTFEVVNTAANAAECAVEIETGVATNVYTRCQRLLRPGHAVIRPAEAPYSFFVPAGRRYRFVQQALAGTTETIIHYSHANV